MDVGLVIELPLTLDLSVKSLDTLSDNRVPKTLHGEWRPVRSSDDAALLSLDILGVDFGGVTAKDEVSSILVLVLLWVSCILPDRLESVFYRIIEVMHE